MADALDPALSLSLSLSRVNSAFVLPPAIELYLGSDAKSLPKRAKSAALRAALREADAIYEAESQDKVKAEQDSDEDDERAAAAVEDDISTYEAQRLANIRQNAEMLSKLGLDAPIVVCLVVTVSDDCSLCLDVFDFCCQESASPAAREKRAARGLRQRAHRPVVRVHALRSDSI